MRGLGLGKEMIIPRPRKEKKMKKILLIEDDSTLAEMYGEQFKLSGIEMVTAKDGVEGFKKVNSKIDLVLLDILLPDENGFEILKKLKSNKNYKKIPVVILTNLGTERADKNTHLALSLGAEDFLVKANHTPAQVVKKIEDILS